MNVLAAYVRANATVHMEKEDLFIPPVMLPREAVSESVAELIAEKLEKRLSNLQKKQSFEGIIFSELPLIHQKRLDEIRFLKRQIILRELMDEVRSAEEMVQKIQGQYPDQHIRDLLVARIELLKKKIEDRMDS
jgi:hypothetical protein